MNTNDILVNPLISVLLNLHRKSFLVLLLMVINTDPQLGSVQKGTLEYSNINKIFLIKVLLNSQASTHEEEDVERL